MSLLLQNKGMSRLELGRESGLSAQTISVIVRSLEQDGLVVRGEAQRGRVGPPTIPMSLNPEGAFSLGVSVGSRATDIVLIDFLGKVRFREAFYYDTPALQAVKAFLAQTVPEVVNRLKPNSRNRIIGMGVALPSTIQSWPKVGGDNDWKEFDFETFLAPLTDLPIFIQNDITAAASAESLFGEAKSLNDYLFFFIGARTHNRLILNQRIYAGNAGPELKPNLPGVLTLEKMIGGQETKTSQLWRFEEDWSAFGQTVDEWTTECRDALCVATSQLCTFIDVRTVVVSGITPPRIQRSICEQLEVNLQGIDVVAANVGPLGKAIGAASLPFISRFMVHDDVEHSV
ncbi:MAG: ROK family transcriptional regulator [Stappiaceae bacterium]